MEKNILTLYDDPVFPVTRQGNALYGGDMILESDAGASNTPELDKVQISARQSARTKAMSAVMSWIADGDYSYTALDEYITGAADLDGDFEITNDEEEYYNEIWREVPDALLTVGASAENVTKFVNDEDAGAGAIIGKNAEALLNEVDADDDEIIVGFAMGEDAVFENATSDPKGRHMILEATYKKMKAVRDGQVQILKKRTSGKVRLSAAQRAGVKKMLRKSHTAAANLARKKSMKVRKQHGM